MKPKASAMPVFKGSAPADDVAALVVAERGAPLMPERRDPNP